MTDILDVVRHLVTQVVPVPLSDVHPDSSLTGDLGLDSIAAMELLSMLDERLQLEIDMEETVGLTTVGDIADLARRRLAAARATA